MTIRSAMHKPFAAAGAHWRALLIMVCAGAGLAMPTPAAAQCRVGSGPDMGDGIPWCSEAPGGSQSGPRPTAWINVAVSVVMHPDSGEVWAIWNVREEQGGQAGADRQALSACGKVMGRGCFVAASGVNGTVAVARNAGGFLAAAFAADENQAYRDALDLCLEGSYSCNRLRAYAARPWQEYTDAPGINALKRDFPARNKARGQFGAVSISGSGPSRAWGSGGHPTVQAAQAAALAACEAGGGRDCSSPMVNLGGVIAVYRDQNGLIGAVNARSGSGGLDGVMRVCGKDNLSCTVLGFFNVSKAGSEAFE